jgi:hypothetical protein
VGSELGGRCIGGGEVGLIRCCLSSCCVLCFQEKRRLVPFSVPGHDPLRRDMYGRVGLNKENLHAKFQILNRLSRG